MTVQLTQEQFQELLGRISAIHSSAKKNFTQCPLRFYGERDHFKVDEFINAVTAFKKHEQIPDEDALFGLPLLLKDAASTWWAGVCSEVNSWTEALDCIRSNYAPKLPPYEIYMKIFASPQGKNEALDTFLNIKKQWLSMLPPDRHSEEVQLDLIYGLLKLDLRKEIPRNEFKTFAELEARAIHLESEKSAKLAKSIQPPIAKRPKKRCLFCRYKGHTVDVCKKRMAKMAEELKSQTDIGTTWKRKTKPDSPMSPTSTVDSPISPPTVTDSPASPPAVFDSPASPPAFSYSPASPLVVPDSPSSPPAVFDSPASPPAFSYSPASPLVVPDSPSSPPLTITETPASPPLMVLNSNKSVPVMFSPMSPTTDDEEPTIFCFGCGAPNVWKSICVKCKNT